MRDEATAATLVAPATSPRHQPARSWPHKRERPAALMFASSTSSAYGTRRDALAGVVAPKRRSLGGKGSTAPNSAVWAAAATNSVHTGRRGGWSAQQAAAEARRSSSSCDEGPHRVGGGEGEGEGEGGG